MQSVDKGLAPKNSDLKTKVFSLIYQLETNYLHEGTSNEFKKSCWSGLLTFFATLREEIFANFFFGHFAGIIFRELSLTKDFGGINFRELGFNKDFAGINFRELSLRKDFAGINFRELSLTKDFLEVNLTFAFSNVFPRP